MLPKLGWKKGVGTPRNSFSFIPYLILFVGAIHFKILIFNIDIISSGALCIQIIIAMLSFAILS